jgi:iron complex outermembrane recepter protein
LHPRHPNPLRPAVLALGIRLLAAWLGWLLSPAFAFAGPDNTPRPFRVQAGPASETLKQFAEQAQREILFPSEPLADVRTPRVFGDYPPREALDRLLAGTRLRAREAPETGGFAISPAAPASAADASSSPNLMKTKSTFAAIAGWLALGAATAIPAQTPAATLATGAIQGRVSNPATGEYLELVRITIEGTAREAFTDATGRYRLTNVPAGTAKVKAFRTGVSEQTLPVQVTAGQTVQRDFNLMARQESAGGGTVKLSEFVVTSSKEMDNAALAINTQRFAPNQMNVVAADEYGGAAESKVGEILKSMPGIAMDLGGGGEPYRVSLDGVPSANVPITVGGFALATSMDGTSRAVGLHQFAINSISRIEVVNTPTPESSGAALAGSVNMVPLTAFEREKPLYTMAVTVSMRDDARSLKRTPGPMRDLTHKIRPGFEFSGVVPVNKRFGFSISASASTLYRLQTLSQNTWRGAGAATNGGTLPDTTPDKPYLTDYAVRDGGAMVTAVNFGTTLDFQVSKNDQLSFAFQWGFSDFALTQRVMTFLVNRVTPGNFNATSTRGFAGAGEVQISTTVNGLGGNFYMPTLTYRHKGPVWQSEVGLSHSQSDRWRKDITKGRFNTSIARRQGVTVSFDDIFYLRPGTITVADGVTGAPVDPYQLDGYRLSTAGTNAFNAIDLQRTAFSNIKRDFFGTVPLTLKAGIDVRQQIRDQRYHSPTTLTFVGRDAVANSADDNALAVIDRNYSGKIAPYGFPAVQWTSNHNLLDLYKSNPGYFTENKATTYTQTVAQSRHGEEIVSAAYIRGDARFLNGRLKLVGGVRAEQTNVKAEGRLIDPTRNFLRDSSGKVVVGTNGVPLPITSDALGAVRLTNVDRGLRAEKEYLRWFPSINATFNVAENLIARAGYYWSVGRPDFNQYGGSANLPNTENPPGRATRSSSTMLRSRLGVHAPRKWLWNTISSRWASSRSPLFNGTLKTFSARRFCRQHPSS